MGLDVVDTLRELVAIPSVNPMAGFVSGAEVGEARLTEHLESLLKGMGLACFRQEVHPGRDNLIARLDGHTPPECGGELILFGVHQDTVPVTGMTVDPFRGEVRGGRVYGRGACDVKGGMAAMLSAMARLSEERPAGMPTILLGLTVNEECGFTGAHALAELCGGQAGGWLPRRPDMAVVAEPTELEIVVAHKGVVRWRCHTRGRAAHSSRPEDGESAIYKMGHALAAMERYQRDVVGSLGVHPLCGRPTMSVGTIRGGVGVNIVPDHCVVEIDRRLLPGEGGEVAYGHAIAYLAQQLGREIALEHDPPFMTGPGLSDEENQGPARRLGAAAAAVVGRRRPVGVAYATDAAFLAAAGIPTVVFGPGSAAQAHTVDEWIAVDELEKGAEIYYRFGRGGV